MIEGKAWIVCGSVVVSGVAAALGQIGEFPQPAVVAEPAAADVGAGYAASNFPAAKQKITITYGVRRPIHETIRTPNGVTRVTRFAQNQKTVTLPIDVNLDELELPPAGERAAVLAITAARHDDLLKRLKEATNEKDRQMASAALKDNYLRHYAIETWWRGAEARGAGRAVKRVACTS